MSNVGFQWSLNKIGISLAVPICLGVLIVTGALVDWLVLKDKPSRRTLWSMVILITAVVVLSTGGEQAFEQLKQVDVADAQPYLLAMAIGAVIISGINYGVFDAVIKVVGNRGVSQPAIMTIISVTGFVFLLLLSSLNGSWELERSFEFENLAQMTLAGICNAIAFVALCLQSRSFP